MIYIKNNQNYDCGREIYYKERYHLLITQKEYDAKISIRNFNATVFLGCSAFLVAAFSANITLVGSEVIQNRIIAILSMIGAIFLICIYFFVATKRYKKLTEEKLQADKKLITLEESASMNSEES